MKTIIFNKEINITNIKSLIDEIDISLKEELPQVYFSGTGNDIEAETIFIDYISQKTEQNINIELIAFNKLNYGAFNIFYKCSAVKTILPTAIGLIGLPQDKKAIKESMPENKLLAKIAKNDNVEYMKWILLTNLPDKYIRKIKAGKEVYLSNLYLKSLLENYGNILVKWNR
jgi:hypothetical protein